MIRYIKMALLPLFLTVFVQTVPFDLDMSDKIAQKISLFRVLFTQNPVVTQPVIVPTNTSWINFSKISSALTGNFGYGLQVVKNTLLAHKLATCAVGIAAVGGIALKNYMQLRDIELWLADSTGKNFKFCTWRSENIDDEDQDRWPTAHAVLSNKQQVIDQLFHDATKTADQVWIDKRGVRIEPQVVTWKDIVHSIKRELTVLEEKMAFVGQFTQAPTHIIKYLEDENILQRTLVIDRDTFGIPHNSVITEGVSCLTHLPDETMEDIQSVIFEKASFTPSHLFSHCVSIPNLYRFWEFRIAPSKMKATKLYWQLCTLYVRLTAIKEVLDNAGLYSQNDSQNKFNRRITKIIASINDICSKQQNALTNDILKAQQISRFTACIERLNEIVNQDKKNIIRTIIAELNQCVTDIMNFNGANIGAHNQNITIRLNSIPARLSTLIS